MQDELPGVEVEKQIQRDCQDATDDQDDTNQESGLSHQASPSQEMYEEESDHDEEEDQDNTPNVVATANASDTRTSSASVTQGNSPADLSIRDQAIRANCRTMANGLLSHKQTIAEKVGTLNERPLRIFTKTLSCIKPGSVFSTGFVRSTQPGLEFVGVSPDDLALLQGQGLDGQPVLSSIRPSSAWSLITMVQRLPSSWMLGARNIMRACLTDSESSG